MQFPDNYFDDEVRDGFFVPALIKRSWAAQLEVLNDIAEVCKKHGIRWFADCGTLIGAVRHGGFVPWDDDLDICMLREDYDRFNEVAPKELPEGYCVLNMTNSENFENMLTRVANGYEINFNKDYLNKYHNFPYSAGVDVFVLDYLAADEEAENVRKNLVKIVVTLLDGINDDNQNEPENEPLIEQVEKLCNVTFDRKSSIRRQYFQLIDKLDSIYTADEAEEVALMSYWVQNDNHRYKMEWFKDTVELPFENTYIQAPAMYDAVLKTEYGDYMRIVQKGGVHDYPFFSSQEKVAEKAMGGRIPYRYYFSENDLRPCVREENVRAANKKKLGDILELMSELQVNAVKMVENGDGRTAIELLMQCQNGAISMGNAIEEWYGEGRGIVKQFESYCEHIYNLYNAINASAGDMQLYENKLDDALKNVEAAFNRDVAERREVVFMPYKASMWDSMDGIWRECMNDKSCDVYVVPIPYGYKGGNGGVLKEYYEGELFPKEVNVTFYNDYDFAQRHPDAIYIQCPYDKYNAVLSVHPFGYSDNIRKYTDELVFVQPFVVDEIEEEHEKARLNIAQYFCSPGVMHADKVIVQSNAMKKLLVDVLTRFAGGDTEKLWENKLIVNHYSNSGESRRIRRERMIDELPEEWRRLIYRADGSRKKLVLYNNSVSTLLEYGEKLMDKLMSVLNIFRSEAEDIVLIWKNNTLIRPTLERDYPSLWKHYSEVIDGYIADGWGIYDDRLTTVEAVQLCDAYYGDADGIVQKCRREGMPVMIESIDIL